MRDVRDRRDAFAAALVLLALCAGCASETVKVVEGTDLSVGFTIPGMEGEANFTVFNYLSGFKTTTAESNRVKLTYSCAESNSYFGVIQTRTAKSVKATIEPVVDEAEGEGDAQPDEDAAQGGEEAGK